ncbi:hypothetical protein PTKIN_Ptkin13bG0137000 [Pterospermum kingtungense]
MQGTASKSPLKSFEEEVDDDDGEPKETGKKLKEKLLGYETDDISDGFQCINIIKREPSKKDYSDKRELLSPQQRSRSRFINHDIPEFFGAKHGLWRQEQKSRAAKLEKQLKARKELEALIEEQLNRFNALYNQAMFPSHLEDVTELLMPQWAAPQELATLSWLGDWRPSAILELLHGLALSSFLSDSTAREHALSQLIHEIRIEELIIDEEMAEIQATCILYLPFAPVKRNKSGGSALHGIQSEFKKVARVITKAQKLRFKALEMVVKKVLNQTDAAEFLVAFSGIQDAIHQFAEQKRLRKGPVTVSVKSQDVVESSKQPKIQLEDRISLWEKIGMSSEQKRSGQGNQYAIREFEEQQMLLQKGSVTMSVNSQDVVETPKQPNIHLEDRISSWEKTSVTLEQKQSSQGIRDGIHEFEEQQSLEKGPVTRSVISQDVIENSKQPNIHLADRTSLWEKFSLILEQDINGQEQ